MNRTWDSYMNTYANMSDLDVQRMRRSPRNNATKNTRYWVILILGVLLILGFLILVSLVSLLFSYYKSMRDEMSLLKDNGYSADPKCSVGWTQYGLSCYNLSSDSKPWNDSKKDCEDRKAHLVVINGEGEMDFLRGFSEVKYVWISLTEADGTWKWVDGTSYNMTPKFWENNQPDDYRDPDLGGGEDCAMIWNRKKWNDNHCSKSFQYVCEKKIF